MSLLNQIIQYNISLLPWFNDTLYLTPTYETQNYTWLPLQLPVPKIEIYLNLSMILAQSTQLHDYLQKTECQLVEHRLSTTIIANKLLEYSHFIATDANHNWYDWLFSHPRMTYRFVPLYVIVFCYISVLTIICCCNICMYMRIRYMYDVYLRNQFSYLQKQA